MNINAKKVNNLYTATFNLKGKEYRATLEKKGDIIVGKIFSLDSMRRNLKQIYSATRYPFSDYGFNSFICDYMIRG